MPRVNRPRRRDRYRYDTTAGRTTKPEPTSIHYGAKELRALAHSLVARGLASPRILDTSQRPLPPDARAIPSAGQDDAA